MIAVVDYGAGNLTSVLKGLRAAGGKPCIVRSATEITGAAGIVIPGVGHFEATRALDPTWRAVLTQSIDAGVPLLGICLGMQWLYEGSDEAPDLAGLGIFKGRVFRVTGNVKVPHVGWNTLDPGDAAVYFTHSFAAPVTQDTVASTEHGVRFAAIAARGSVTGMQFHPEKSGAAGLSRLSQWVASCSVNA